MKSKKGGDGGLKTSAAGAERYDEEGNKVESYADYISARNAKALEIDPWLKDKTPGMFTSQVEIDDRMAKAKKAAAADLATSGRKFAPPPTGFAQTNAKVVERINPQTNVPEVQIRNDATGETKWIPKAGAK
jgi:hypothetical protein